MSEIIGDDYPTYEESVNMSLAERKKDSVHTYMTEVEHEIHKDNLERLMQENFELKHRLSCVADDILIISNHIEENCNKRFKRPSLNPDGSVYADEAWHNVSNIEIACDLTDDAPLEWGSKVKGELTQDQIIEMEQQVR
jgi:hypothetical protein